MKISGSNPFAPLKYPVIILPLCVYVDLLQFGSIQIHIFAT